MRRKITRHQSLKWEAPVIEVGGCLQERGGWSDDDEEGGYKTAVVHKAVAGVSLYTQGRYMLYRGGGVFIWWVFVFYGRVPLELPSRQVLSLDSILNLFYF